MIELTLEDFKYFSEKQALLDEAIMWRKRISRDMWLYELEHNHEIALKVEIAEFVNECSNIWKYWKDKEPNRERILDEAIDVLHFVFLKLNKSNNFIKDHYLYYFRRKTVIKIVFKGVENKSVCLSDLLRRKDELSILANVMYILSEYGFTREDVIEQYNKKNAVNFERLENGY